MAIDVVFGKSEGVKVLIYTVADDIYIYVNVSKCVCGMHFYEK